jgi:hypothetical protein
MPSFEALVRPFETPRSSPATPGIATIPQLTPDAILVVQGGGQVKSGGFSYSVSVTFYADAKQYEVGQ